MAWLENGSEIRYQYYLAVAQNLCLIIGGLFKELRELSLVSKMVISYYLLTPRAIFTLHLSETLLYK